MRQFLLQLSDPYPSRRIFNISMLLFRIAASLEMIIVHGFKKIGIGTATPEKIPNPLHLLGIFNNAFAISANIVFPFFVLIGFCTRLATLPSLAVTLTGYFVVHWNDSLLEKDTPFVYSLIFLLILLMGPGKYAIDNSIHKKSLQ